MNLFIAGVGNVGSKLAGAVATAASNILQQHLRLQVRVVGMANSKKMVFNDEGIDLDNWKEALQKGETDGSCRSLLKSSDQRTCAILFLQMLRPMMMWQQVMTSCCKKYFGGGL